MTLPHPARTKDLGWQRLLFTAALVLALLLIGLNGLLVVRSELFNDILNPRIVGAAAAHFNTVEHRIHDLTFGLLYSTGAIGLLTQIRSPRRHVGGLLMALLPWASLGLVFLLTSYWVAQGTQFQMYATAVYGGFTLSALLLHPGGRDLLRSFDKGASSKPMLAMAVAAGIPTLIFGAVNVGLQRSEDAANIHWQIGHYGFMAAISFTMVGLAIMASLRPFGWRIPAWAAGVLPTLFGVLSLLNPDVDSAFSLPWALLAIAWGVGFVAVAEHTHRGDDTRSGSTRGWILDHGCCQKRSIGTRARNRVSRRR